ncbi:MFS transporter [Clostridium sp. MT-14]|nr:MFS transporter [Clostridium sp. HV4-5-A1G]KAA8677022.1 MFS transporter [Clostridium sp. HV4-5-A1G]CAB1243503.1 MFS domain-containing protein [Clostridiaceae bacterium BL-3]
MQSEKTRSGKLKIRGLRWWMFVFFLIIGIFNYMDRISLSIPMSLIGKQLHIGTMFTGIVLSAFFWSYTLMQLPGGWLVDKFKPRRIVTCALIGWGLAESLTGLANSFMSLIIIRLFLGVFEGPVQVGCNTSLVSWLLPYERGRGSTLVDSGGQLGAALGGIVVTGLIMWLGTWRIAFAILGVLTILIGIVAYLFMRDNPSEHPMITEEEVEYLSKNETGEEDNKITGGNILLYFKHASPWMLLLGFASYDAVVYGLLTWIPYYIQKVRHISFGMTGVWTMLIFGCGFIGEIIAGQLSDRWRRHPGASTNVVMKTMLGFAGIAVAISVLMVNFVQNATAAVLLISIANFFLRWGGLYWSVPQMLVDKQHVGRLSGAMNFAGNVTGIIIPILIGWIAAFSGGFTATFVIFCVAGLLMTISSISINYSHKLS